MCAMSFVLSAFGAQAKQYKRDMVQTLLGVVGLRTSDRSHPPDSAQHRHMQVSRERIKSSQGWQGL